MSDHGKSKIGDTWVASFINEDIRLGGHKHGEMRARVSTHALKVAMNQVAGMEVFKAFGDIEQLTESQGLHNGRGRSQPYERTSVHKWFVSDVSWKVFAMCPT